MESHRDDPYIKIIDREKVLAEFKQIYPQNLWEGVIFLANEGLTDEARELQNKLLQKQENQIRQDLQDKLQEGQTLTDGILISGPDEKRRYIIGVANRRYDVDMLIEPPPPPEMCIPGREVWVHPETMAILKLRDSYIQGEAAPVIEIVDPAKLIEDKSLPEPEKQVHPEKEQKQKEKIQETPKQEQPENKQPVARLLLKVKSRQEEIVVEAIPALAEKKPRVGDTVRILSALGIALDLLSRGRQDVLLGEVPDVEYKDIGGLDTEIAKIREAVEEPYTYPTLFQRYNLQRPRGILLYGPPGCGKTMIAKAIANNLFKQIEQSLQQIKTALELYIHLQNKDHSTDTKSLLQIWQAQYRPMRATKAPNNLHELMTEIEVFLRARGIKPAQAAEELQQIDFAKEQGGRSYFVSIKGPELLSKWVGETESSIRSIFEMARDRATFYTPVILFFDELESMFSRRGSGISSDVQKTIVPQLLAEIDGIEATRNIIVVGASNRFDLIDPAVLRPGRLDFKIKIPRPDREQANSILSKYLTSHIPFAITELALVANEKTGLSDARYMQYASLGDCLSDAVSEIAQTDQEVQVALFLKEFFTKEQNGQPILKLGATSGFEIEENHPVLTAWQAADGIVAKVITSAKPAHFKEDPASQSEKRSVSAWPLKSPNPDESAQVWGVIVVGYLANSKCLKNLQPRLEPLLQLLTATIQLRRKTAERLIGRVLDIIFHAQSRLIIMELKKNQSGGISSREPRTSEKRVEEVVSGAMLESVVSRAKRAAVKREIKDKTFGHEGITWGDLYASIRTECEEGKDQYIYELYDDNPFSRDQAYHDAERFKVEVILPPPDEKGDAVTWITSKPYAWRNPDVNKPSA